MNKQSLRRKMLAERMLLGLDYIKTTSASIARKFLDGWSGFESYLLYSPVKNEVDTGIIAEELWRAGKTVLFPVVYGESLKFGICTCMDELECGFKGIKEPAQTTERLCPQVIVVPGVAFDLGCYRLGFGKGYYDRLLAEISAKSIVGLAYQWQIVRTVYPEQHDKPVNAVLTESSVYSREY